MHLFSFRHSYIVVASYAKVTVFAFCGFLKTVAGTIHSDDFKLADADCGGMRLRLLPIFLSDHFFPNPSLSHKFGPHYSKDLKHEMGLPACGCQILGC